VAKKENGESCSEGAQCLSDFCVDSVCCSSACDGDCQSCTLADSLGVCTFYGYGTDDKSECDTCYACNGAGACAPVMDGQDPVKDCPQGDPKDCGLDGFCNGAGACRYWGSGTLCTFQSCDALTDMLTPAGNCNGGGNCIEPADYSCCPFGCHGDSCGTSCTSDTNCCATAICKKVGSCTSCALNCTAGDTCCGGDSCDDVVDLPDPGDWVDPGAAGDGNFYSSTWGSNNMFSYNSTTAGGYYSPDRVFTFNTNNTGGVGVKLKIEVSANFDAVIYLRKDTCGAGGVAVDYNNNCAADPQVSCISETLPANQTYYLYVDGTGSTQKGDFTLKMTYVSLCAADDDEDDDECNCDSGYGENTTNNPLECLERGDYCGNYHRMVFTKMSVSNPINPATCGAYYPGQEALMKACAAGSTLRHSGGSYPNLAGDNKDFTFEGGTYAKENNCSRISDGDNAQGAAGQYGHIDSEDKIYKLVIPQEAHVYIQMSKQGGWSPSNSPRFYVWGESASGECPGDKSKGTVCKQTTGSSIAYGTFPMTATWPAGTYWLIASNTRQTTMSSARYELRVTLWCGTDGLKCPQN